MEAIPIITDHVHHSHHHSIMTKQIKDLKSVISHMDLIFNSCYEGLIVSDEKGIIIQANSSIERISGGIKPELLLGKTPKELEKEGIIISQEKIVLQLDPLTIRQKLKTDVEVLVTTNRIYDSVGQLCFFVSTIRDMSHLQYLQKELEQSRNLNKKYFRELQKLRNVFMDLMEFDQVIAKSPGMMSVMEKVFKVARTEANVLLTGESGVGKEVVAKLLHKMSYRKDGPFIQINCGAIPDSLLESELFGYEKGAFTDALRCGKPGFFELANKGNILLDEIGDLPLNLQVKLHRVIQEKEVFRLGGVKPIKLDVRLIAATNRSLEEMVKQNTFREDLYYRLNVFPIQIPPLRERKTDILPLAEMFLHKYNERHALKKRLSPGICNFLKTYSWPGNIRELKNMIEHLVIISDQDEINLDHVSDSLLKVRKALFPNPEIPTNGDCNIEDIQANIPSSGFGSNQANLSNGLFPQSTLQGLNRGLQQTFETILHHDCEPPSLQRVREIVEQQFISAALKKYKSQRKASKAIGIDHTTLTRKIKKWGTNVSRKNEEK